MNNEFTNLLPLERIRLITRDYYVRLGVVILWFLTALVVSSAVLLIPTYFFLAGSAEKKEAALAEIQATVSSADEAAFASRVAVLSTNIAALSSLADQRSVSHIIRTTLLISRPGIVLSGFSYVTATAKTRPSLDITGVATTRNALRNYQIALQGAPFVEAANLPVSAYAKDTEIQFTINTTLTP